jgi:tetratricopeptide (TPR) repeat protein
MPKENQERDAIVSKMIGGASEEKSAASIAPAGGDNTELKQQVEVQVNDEPSPEKGEASHAEDHKQLWKWAPKHRRMVTASAVLLLLLLVAAVGGISLAVRAWHKEKQAREAEQQAVEKNKTAEREAEQAKRQLHQSEEEKKTRRRERDEAWAAEKAAQGSAEDAKAVVAFLQNNVFLAPGHPKSWSGVGLGKDVTLRKTVDAAASKVAGAFPDRPMVEASIREILGASYLNLGEAEQAVQQYKRAFELRKEVRGPDDPVTSDCRNKLAVAYRNAGHTDEASNLFELFPDSSSPAALALQGSLLLSQNKPVEAELKLRECLAVRQRRQPDDWTTFHTMQMLGTALLEQKNFKGAEPLMLSGYEGMKQRESQIPSQDKVQLKRALERLVQFYEVCGKKDKAAQWRKTLEQMKATKKP